MDTSIFDGDIEEFDFSDFFTVPENSYCIGCDTDVTSVIWTNRLTGEDFHECPMCSGSVTPISQMVG